MLRGDGLTILAVTAVVAGLAGCDGRSSDTAAPRPPPAVPETEASSSGAAVGSTPGTVHAELLSPFSPSLPEEVKRNLRELFIGAQAFYGRDWDIPGVGRTNGVFPGALPRTPSTPPCRPTAWPDLNDPARVPFERVGFWPSGTEVMFSYETVVDPREQRIHIRAIGRPSCEQAAVVWELRGTVSSDCDLVREDYFWRYREVDADRLAPRPFVTAGGDCTRGIADGARHEDPPSFLPHP